MIVSFFQSSLRRQLTQIVVVTSLAISLGGCATLEKNPQIGETFSKVGGAMSKAGGAVKNGFKKATAGNSSSKKSSSSAKSDKSAQLIAAKYPINQMPHTMMKKPVGDGRLSSSFGPRRNPTGFFRLPKHHNGIDYAAPIGTPIYAAASGEIEKIYVSSSYGKYILIAHENDFSTAYAHMNAFAEGLEVGTKVKRGQIIGQLGNTGKSSGPHLHFELKYKGKFMDPLFTSAPAEQMASDKPASDDT